MVIEGHYSLHLPRQSGIKCFLRSLFEIDDMGKTKIKISVVRNEKRKLEDKCPAYASHQLFLCYFLKIADLAFSPVCEVRCVLKRWEKQVYCSQLLQAKEQGICNYFVGLKRFERWYLAKTPSV